MNTDSTTQVRQQQVTRPGLPARLRAALTTLSDRAHAAGDARARAAGWTITRTPGPAGLHGRAYRDPRFASRQPCASPPAPAPAPGLPR